VIVERQSAYLCVRMVTRLLFVSAALSHSRCFGERLFAMSLCADRAGVTSGIGIIKKMAERTGLEPATPGVTGRYSNQLNYRSAL
jgi:hypothetical protein